MSTPEQERYLWFVQERHRIFERRRAGLPQSEWTSDPVLQNFKFCNDFRFLDRGSQFLLRVLQSESSLETKTLRAFVYRLTNEPSVWEWYHSEVGHFPTLEDVSSGVFRSVLGSYTGMIFSPAYVIVGGAASAGRRRVDWLIGLVEHLVRDTTIFRDLVNPDPRSRMVRLTKVPRIGKFLGMQITTDIGYIHGLGDFGSENEFVVAGPGAQRGARILSPNERPERTITDLWRRLIFDGPSVDVQGVPRPLSLMDVQNTLCEFQKYERRLVSRSAGERAPYSAKTKSTSDIVLPASWTD